ncbi:LysR family transcriptional regulator [Marinobacter bohaiensis]|uniref:LysR family transcriptional regulator n=1 Tax=Marinobacter bohaiensis TaxID=2201898 RepID=UPI000DAF4642|nr:LysR family transcriptional regulator [Marinobacter bohaiensis]
MNNNSPNIRHLRAFLAVAECQSISKATNQVYLSQPAITQALSKLETSFETRLFDRKSDGMYLTATGEVFAERVRRALETIQDGLREALRIGGDRSGARASQLINLLTTTQLRALVTVSAARSFSLAGRNLGVSQSSLYRSSRDLESLLEIKLLEKTSTGITPSKAALSLIRAAKIGFSEVAQGRDEIQSLQNREVGHLHIGSMALARAAVLPRSINAFSSHYPDFRISIFDGNYDDLLNHLRHAEIDLIVGALRSPLPSDDVVQVELFQSELVIVARPDHPYFSSGPLSLDDLAASGWVIGRPGTPTRRIFEKIFTDHGKPVPGQLIESGSQNLSRAILEDSDRLTLISVHQIQRELNEGALRVLPYELEGNSRPIGITLRKDWRPTRTQQVFIDTLKTQATEIDRQIKDAKKRFRARIAR